MGVESSRAGIHGTQVSPEAGTVKSCRHRQKEDMFVLPLGAGATVGQARGE